MRRRLYIWGAALALAFSAPAHAANYGPYPEETFATCGNASSPVAVVLIHGGWDIGGTYVDNWNIARACDALRAYAVYMVNYRLATAPGQSWPAQWQDAQLAVRWLRFRGYAIVGLMGISAGAYNALGVALSPSTIIWPNVDALSEASRFPLQSSLPDFTIAVSPFSDLTDGQLSPIAVGKIVSNLSGLPTALAQDIASPIVRVRPGGGALLVVHGENDEIVPSGQSHALCDAARAVGMQIDCLFTQGKHVFGGYTTQGLADVEVQIAAWLSGQIAAMPLHRKGRK